MLPQVYKGTAVNIRFWYLEFTQIIEYKERGLSDEEIKNLQEKDNFILAPSRSYGKKIVNTNLKRIKNLPQELIDRYLSEDTSTQKLIVLFSIMLSDRFFFEFVYDVYRPSIRNDDPTLTLKKEVLFIDQKNKESIKVSTFTEQTKKRIVSSFKNYFREANLLKHSGDEEVFVRAFVKEDIKNILLENDLNFILKALDEERSK